MTVKPFDYNVNELKWNEKKRVRSETQIATFTPSTFRSANIPALFERTTGSPAKTWTVCGDL